MHKPVTTYPGRVITSRDGAIAVELLSVEGPHPVQGRDASAYYFALRREPGGERSRCAVIFSWESSHAEWSGFSLPDPLPKDQPLLGFAEAAVGEYLDAKGIPPHTPSGVSAASIECFSGQFAEWRDRPRATDEEILLYIEGLVYWNWKYEKTETVLQNPDFLRLRAPQKTVSRVAKLGEGQSWDLVREGEGFLVLQPTPGFLRTQQALRSPGQPTRVAEELLLSLQSPRYAGVRESWKKALDYTLGATRDLPNGAKEAVSAVEGLARIVTGRRTDTLGELIKHLKATSQLDAALAKTLDGVWGFASNSPGVRHGSPDTPTIDQGQAGFVLDTCAAALRLLLGLDK